MLKAIGRLGMLVGVGMAGLAGDAHAETYEVPSNQPDQIQALIDGTIQTGDVIQLGPGLFALNATIDLRGRAFTLQGTVDKGGNPLTVLDGRGSFRVIKADSGEDEDMILRDLTIINGRTERGAGLYVYFASPRVERCRFSLNQALAGSSVCNGVGGGAAYLYRSNSCRSSSALLLWRIGYRPKR